MRGKDAVLVGQDNITPFPSVFLPLPASWCWLAKTGCVGTGGVTAGVLPGNTAQETHGATVSEVPGGQSLCVCTFLGRACTVNTDSKSTNQLLCLVSRADHNAFAPTF